MESPLKRLAMIGGSSRAIAVSEAHRAHEATSEHPERSPNNWPPVPVKAPSAPRPQPLLHRLRAVDPAKSKKLSRDMRERITGLNSPSANARALRALEKRARKAQARLACLPST